MSIIGTAFNDVVSFISNLGRSTPSTNLGQNNPAPAPTPAPGAPPAPAPGYTLQQGIKDGAALFGPLITNAISRPKPLPLPEAPKFPGVPANVANDPRVQNLLGSYGFPNNMPSIQPQKLTRPSAFQLAFPAMFDVGMQILDRQFVPATPANATPTPAVPAAPTGSTAPPTTVIPAQSTTPQSGLMTPATPPVDPNVMTPVTPPDSGLNYTPEGKPIPASVDYDAIIVREAKARGIDPNLARAVVQTESGGDTNAVGDKKSKTPAYGLGQFQTGVASNVAGRPISKEDLADPNISIPIMMAHLANLSKKYGNDYEKVFSAYNAGETRFDSGRTTKLNNSNVRSYLRKANKNYALAAQRYPNATG